MPTPLEISTDAELDVLAGLLLNRHALTVVGSILAPEDFALEPHSRLYRCMLELGDAGAAPDIALLWQRYPEAVEAVGFANLVNRPIWSFNVEHYARTVLEASIRRQVARAGEDVTASAFDSADDAAAVVARAETLLSQARSRAATDPYEDDRAFLTRLFERLSGPAQEDAAAVLSGFAPLDALLRGFKPGELIIVAARPSVGKTSLAVSIMHTVACRHHLPTAIFSLEMTRDSIGEKLLCLHSGLPFRRLVSHNLTDRELATLSQAVAEVDASPLSIIPAREWSIASIRAEARRLHEIRPLRLVVVDYLQLVSADRRENRTQEVTAISAGLKGMALELNLPVMALSQLNRQPESRPKGEPMLSELRESGAIEQDADVVMMVFRPPEYDPDNEQAVEDVVIRVAKNRMGEKGKIVLGFRGSHMEFVDLLKGRAP